LGGSARGPAERPRRALGRLLQARQGAPYLFPLLLVVLVIGAGWWLRDATPRLAGAVADPDTRIRAALARQRSLHLSDVYGFDAGGTLELAPVRFGDLAITVDGERARVVAMVEGEGVIDWRRGRIRVGYIGRERFSMTPCDLGGWCADGRQLDELRRVLPLLFRRLDAFNARDAAAYGRLVGEGYRGAGGKAAVLAQLARDFGPGPAATLTVTAWQLRVEPGRVVVGEDERVRVGDGPETSLRARLELKEENGRWVIVDGLM
jgi:hypothetical protein